LIAKQVFNATYIVNEAAPQGTFLSVQHHGGWRFGSDRHLDDGQESFRVDQGNVGAACRDSTPARRPAWKNAYSPLVDLAASPNLGAKTILFVLDGLYCGRKWRTYPLHFPNPPFNNPTEPYENPHWPASVLASLDGVGARLGRP